MRAGPFVHLLENSYASGNRKRPRGPRSLPTAELSCDLAGVAGGLGQRRPGVDLKTQAMFYYVRNHLHTLGDAPTLSKGFSVEVLPSWMAIAECPVLDLALSSIALAVFSRTQHHPPAAVEASAKYHQLLRVAQSRVSSLDQGNIDVFLLAVFLMSRYENVVHDRSTSSGQLHSKQLVSATAGTGISPAFQGFLHHDGALAILKFWKAYLSEGQPPTDVIKYTRRSMIKSALLRNLALPEWMVDGSLFGEHGVELEYDRIVIQIASIRNRLSMLLKEKQNNLRCCQDQRTSLSDELISAAEELEKEAGDVDQALRDWRAYLPIAWSYRRQHTLSSSSPLLLSDWQSPDFHSPSVYSYSSPAHAAVWNRYYSTRMLVASTRLKVLEFGGSQQQQHLHDLLLRRRSGRLSELQTMADDLAASLPFCLQRFRVLPITTISPNSERTTSPNPPDFSSSSSSPQSETINIPTLNKDSSNINTDEHDDNDDLKPYLADLTVWPLSIASSMDVKQQSWFRSQLARIGRLMGDRVLELEEAHQWLQL